MWSGKSISESCGKITATITTNSKESETDSTFCVHRLIQLPRQNTNTQTK